MAVVSIPVRTKRASSLGLEIRSVFSKVAFLLADVLVFSLAFALASDLRQFAEIAALPPSLTVLMALSVPSHFICYLVAVCLTLFFFWERGMYDRRLPVWEELRLLVRLILSGAAVESALLFLLTEAPVDKQAVVLTWAIALVLVPAARLALKRLLLALHLWERPVVIVGDGKNAVATYRGLRNDRLLGYKVKTFIAMPGTSPPHARITIDNDTIPVLPLGEDVLQILRELGNPCVILALDSLADAEVVFSRFRTLDGLLVIPPMRGIPLHGVEVSHFFGEDMLVMRVRNNLDSLWARVVKRTVDIALSSLLLILFSPILTLVAVMIVHEDGGPVLFSQKRIGRGGVEFTFLKFRSMVNDAEDLLRTWETTQPVLLDTYRNNNFKLEQDPRVSRVGRWIRRTSIDELPQLLNVIRGDMSLVGPRPLLARELRDYGPEISLYENVRPGVTGVWQVSGRSATSFADRARFDAWYVRNWSLWHDLVILAKTAKVVLSRVGAY